MENGSHPPQLHLSNQLSNGESGNKPTNSPHKNAVQGNLKDLWSGCFQWSHEDPATSSESPWFPTNAVSYGQNVDADGWPSILKISFVQRNVLQVWWPDFTEAEGEKDMIHFDGPISSIPLDSLRKKLQTGFVGVVPISRDTTVQPAKIIVLFLKKNDGSVLAGIIPPHQGGISDKIWKGIEENEKTAKRNQEILLPASSIQKQKPHEPNVTTHSSTYPAPLNLVNNLIGSNNGTNPTSTSTSAPVTLSNPNPGTSQTKSTTAPAHGSNRVATTASLFSSSATVHPTTNPSPANVFPSVAAFHPSLAPHYLLRAQLEISSRLTQPQLVPNYAQLLQPQLAISSRLSQPPPVPNYAQLLQPPLSISSRLSQAPQPATLTTGTSILGPLEVIKGPPPLPYEITPSPALPPGSHKSYAEAVHALVPFVRQQVSSSSREYCILSHLVGSRLSILHVDRIFNPELWRKFGNIRQESMISKTKDLELLYAFRISEHELHRRAHANINSTNEDPALSYYSDNVALLFHCTRGNVDDILGQGLDERLGKPTGLLGRGIYFTDDPMKSIKYDGNGTMLVFAVFLGDCLSVDRQGDQRQTDLVREPPKKPYQQRNHTDFFFDSIVGRPTGVNEYVIYNRYQCTPVYAIKYKRENGNGKIMDQIQEARNQIPPFAWTGRENGRVMPPPQVPSWPFFAQTIFRQMEAVVSPEEPPRPSTSSAAAECDEAAQLARLEQLGFLDDRANRIVLKRCRNNLEKAIKCLDEEKWVSSLNSDTSIKLTRIKTGSPVKKPRVETDGERAEKCEICFNTFPKTPTNWKELNCCTQKICVNCYQMEEKSGKTMAGVSHTFFKCPFCNVYTGIPIGSCPDGTMTVTISHEKTLEGYEGFNVIQVYYQIPERKLSRKALFPQTELGKKVVDLLRVAWDRRIIFSIGTSHTTGATNVPVWNIHHRTALTGPYGYPDPTYLDRVQNELAQYGIR